MWILRLNDMRSPKFEVLQNVAKAQTRHALVDFVVAESVATWRDGPWAKSFRGGSPLEWFNQPWEGGGNYVEVPPGHPDLLLLVEVSTSKLAGRHQSDKLQRRLRWLAERKQDEFPGPIWLGALVAAYAAMDVDEEQEATLGALIDRIEEEHDIDKEQFFDFVCTCGGELP